MARQPTDTPLLQVAVEDDFSSGPRTNPTAPANTGGGYQMNPNHSYGGPTPGFYGGPGPGPGYPPGGPGAYPPPHGAGPMSPYGGGGPMSPYSGQGQPPPGGQPAMYANQNSPFHNQNQSSPYSGPGPGPYNDQSSGGAFPAMQSYYSNQSRRPTGALATSSSSLPGASNTPVHTNGPLQVPLRMDLPGGCPTQPEYLIPTSTLLIKTQL